ncbi:hypothetical protein SacmaDRAFT_4823 [Saccharomonospora marina XMU15]|uniref:Uncharacterized protein n=1 Tax=Saccharomonospora marina XMU15 TaxID=882083 RepID=H5X001_9PSEU|nr:hypothetical protein [Saccharomonospora marina]EHR52997.1 hypothetical protein SacmaDRAFT_4823 [Saccharomonospora marina XMU15]
MVGEKETKTEEQPEKQGLRPVQVIAAGLAATAAAFLGSTLGVYGTVLGAGLFSVVFTVGSELFLRSMERTRVAARALTEAGARLPHKRGNSERAEHAEVPPTEQPTQPAAPLPDPGGEPQQPEEHKQWWKRRWPWLLGTSVVAFVIGMALITGFEGVTGKSLSGEGATTVSRLVGGGAGQPGQDEQDQQDPDSTPSPSVTEGSEPGSTETSPTEDSTTTTEPTESTTREQQQPPPTAPSDDSVPDPGDAPVPGGQGLPTTS